MDWIQFIVIVTPIMSLLVVIMYRLGKLDSTMESMSLRLGKVEAGMVKLDELSLKVDRFLFNQKKNRKRRK